MSTKRINLHSLGIGNFKAFGQTQQIPIRPLTLIYGANSAGKSSIIHSLLLARHGLENGNVDVHQTKLGGESLDLGGFRQYVHKRDGTRDFFWSIEGAHPIVESIAKHLGGFSRTEGRFEIGFADAVNSDRSAPTTPRVVAFELHLDGRRFLRLEHQPGGRLHCVSLNFEHRSLSEAIDRYLDDLARGDLYSFSERERTDEEETELEQRRRAKKLELLRQLRELQEVIAADIAKVPFSTNHIIPLPEVPEGEENDYAYVYSDYDSDAILDSFNSNLNSDFMNFDSNSICDNQGSDDFEIIARKLRYEIEQLFKIVVRPLFTGLLTQLVYLGPLRCYPPRHLTGMQDQDPNWFSGGGQAWEILRQSPEVLQAVNHWLTAPNRLAKGYRLSVQTLVALQNLELALQAQLEDALGRLRVSPNSSVTQQAEAVVRNLIASKPVGALSEIVIKDIQSGTDVSHRDIGQGISQVLPVLVNAFALERAIIAIEQPELHLHPALQSELADVFIESALGDRGNTFLIESHSEHLLLRIMRRMRETHNGTLPEGKHAITPEHVAVLYVEPFGDRSVVREMPLNARGELIKDWPGGFFEEGLREVLT